MAGACRLASVPGFCNGQHLHGHLGSGPSELYPPIRKLLLAVENSNRKLISDGNAIIGISDSTPPDFAITGNFRGDHGFLELGQKKICSFFDGNFHSSVHKAKLVELEELLIDSNLQPETITTLFRTIVKLVHTAEKRRHGCTLVIDINATSWNPAWISATLKI